MVKIGTPTEIGTDAAIPQSRAQPFQWRWTLPSTDFQGGSLL